jgi:SAM-dependent methyltransferase
MFYFDLVICFLSLIFWIYLIHSFWEIAHHRAPFVPSPNTPRKIAIDKISKLLNQTKGQQTIVDAGCGNGKILATLAKKYPQHIFIGIEYNKTLYNYCHHHYIKIKNLTFYNQDLLTYDYEKTNIIYYFGLPSLTKEFEKKICQLETKIDIIALDAQFPKLKLVSKDFFRFWMTQSYVYHYKN